MLLSFDKVGATAKHYTLQSDGVAFEATLTKKNRTAVSLEGKYSGTIALACDRCGTEYNMPLESELNLLLSSEITTSKEDLDIIEFLNGTIDLEYILQSELNAHKESYNYCQACSSKEDYEVEF